MIETFVLIIDKKPSIIPAKGGRKTNGQSHDQLSTHNPVMGKILF